MQFEWDENKNKSNIAKHGISFETAKNVFKDKKRLEIIDDRKDYGEERWRTIGAAFGVILSVIYTIRATAIRLISARRANKKERETYNKH